MQYGYMNAVVSVSVIQIFVYTMSTVKHNNNTGCWIVIKCKLRKSLWSNLQMVSYCYLFHD